MQKHKLDTFNCNICARSQGTVLLDCYCLFCLDCFQSTDIEKEYSEKVKHYKKGKTTEKCQRCKRNTEYKIYHLDKKSESDQCRMLFGGLTGGFMSFFRVLEFQTLQRNREIQNLSTTLQGVYKKLGTLLNENSHLSKYFDEKDIKNIKGLNKSAEFKEIINDPNNVRIPKTANARKIETNENFRLHLAQKGTSTGAERVKTPNKDKKTKYKGQDKGLTSNISTFQDSSKPRERSANQRAEKAQNRSRHDVQTIIGDEEAVSKNQRSYANVEVNKVRGKGMEQKIFEEQSQQNMLNKKSLLKNQGNEYETPIGPQLKKAKITANQKLETNSKEELKKLFGFELKEIKKSSSRPSTEKPDKGNENIKVPELTVQHPKPQLQMQHQMERKNYWGRGYHLNYPNYNQK